MIDKILRKLNSLNVDKLKKVRKELNKIISEKEKLSVKNVIYTHDCYGSSTYHFVKYKHWAKLIKAIDDTKKNGYAFEGEFLNCGMENLVPIDSYVVEICDTELKLYLITGDEEKKLILTGKKNSFVTFIKKCKQEIKID